jgi:hypothetical protein
MAQGNINIRLGCNYLLIEGHIRKDFGMFMSFISEPITKLLSGKILPVSNNTQCLDRRSGKCSINCYKACTVYQVGHSWSPQNIGKRM